MAAHFFAGSVLALLLAGASPLPGTAAPAQAVALPDPAVDLPASGKRIERAVFAGGCFWGVEAVFEHVRGVRGATAGYAGGSAFTAHYEKVETGRTGHAESVEVAYDPAQVSYGQLLKVFFSVAHDPTQVDRQGPDVGSQYRSVVFWRDEAQRDVATAYIAQLDAAKVFARPIATQVAPLKGFHEAEGVHQDYARHHPEDPYIVVNDAPKVANLQAMFPALYAPR